MNQGLRKSDINPSVIKKESIINDRENKKKQLDA